MLMAEEQNNLEAQHEENAEDRIKVTLEIMEQVLGILGESWEQIDELQSQISVLKAEKHAVPHVASPSVATEQMDGVLIIDDSKLMQSRLRIIIESLGFRVIGTAENGEVGAEMTIQKNPKLIILDHNMPVMSGLECLRAIRMQCATVRVIVCAAELTEKLSQEYISNDVYTMITKPIQLDRFVLAVKECMSYEPDQLELELDQL